MNTGLIGLNAESIISEKNLEEEVEEVFRSESKLPLQPNIFWVVLALISEHVMLSAML